MLIITKCKSKESHIAYLEAKIQAYKKEIEEISKKCHLFRKSHEKYLALEDFFNNQKKDNAIDGSLLSGATDELIIDPDYPEIKIRRYQFDLLGTKIKYGEAVRYLIDCLFESEEVSQKSFTILKREKKDKIKVIENYVSDKYKCKLSEIHKAITDKTCRIR